MYPFFGFLTFSMLFFFFKYNYKYLTELNFHPEKKVTINTRCLPTFHLTTNEHKEK